MVDTKSVCAICILSVCAGMSIQNPAKGVIEAEGFRLMVDGQASWEVLPFQAGARMVFRRKGGEEAITVTANNDVVVVRQQSPGARVWEETILGSDVFSETVAAKEGHVVISRRLNLDSEQWRAFNQMGVDNSIASVRLDPKSAESSFVCDTNNWATRLSAKDISVTAKVNGGINVDVTASDEDYNVFTAGGNVLKEFSVALRSKQGKWLWGTSK